MKVALLTDGIWPMVIGGMQKHSMYLAKYLAANGVDVDLYYTVPDNTPIKISDCFEPEELRRISPVFIEFPAQDKFPGHYLRASLRYSERIYSEMLRREKVDLIYAKGLTSWAVLRDPHRNLKVPVCINVHGYEYFQRTTGVSSRLKQFLLRGPFTYINRNADYVFSYGGGITEIIRDKLKIPPGRIVEIPGGISPEFVSTRVSESSHRRKLLFVGRFERRKGIEEVTEAVLKIANNGRFEFQFVGDIPPAKQIQKPGIVYHGVIADSESLKTIMSCSDVLVCASYAEGMPNVIMEAMARGCAIIATDVGAVNMLVDDRNGWLIEPASTYALQSAISSALETSDLVMTQKKVASLDKIKQFLWPEVIKKTIVAFEQIVDKSVVSSLQSHQSY